MRQLIALLTLLPTVVSAAPRDVPYFVAHPAEAQQVVRVCRNNAIYDRSPTCQNAQRAIERAAANRLAAQTGRADALLFDPGYWSQNQFARAVQLGHCERRGPEDQPWLPYCAAAAQSAQVNP